eukprot:c21097_g1_i1 orf=68-814(-)
MPRGVKRKDASLLLHFACESENWARLEDASALMSGRKKSTSASQIGFGGVQEEGSKANHCTDCVPIRARESGFQEIVKETECSVKKLRDHSWIDLNVAPDEQTDSNPTTPPELQQPSTQKQPVLVWPSTPVSHLQNAFFTGTTSTIFPSMYFVNRQEAWSRHSSQGPNAPLMFDNRFNASWVKYMDKHSCTQGSITQQAAEAHTIPGFTSIVNTTGAEGGGCSTVAKPIARRIMPRLGVQAAAAMAKP